MINYKTLRFRNSTIEKDFNEWYLPDELKIFRNTILLGILTNFIFILFDYFLHEGTTAKQFLALRMVTFVIALTVYGLSLNWITNYRRYQFFTSSFALLCFSITALFTFFDNVENFYYFIVNIILVIFVFILFNIRFYYLRFLAISIIGIHLLMLKINFDFTTEGFIHQSFGVIGIMIICLAATWINEFNKRQNFINHQLIEEQKEALKKNIIEKDDLLTVLKERNEELNVFNHSVSHDLKTPLRNIHTFSRLLEKEYKDILDEEGKTYLKFILEGTGKMNSLISDLLAYSKVKHTKLELVNLDMNYLVTTIFQEQAKIFDKQPILSKEVLPNIQADEVLIKQVWNNLISNALKYSSKEQEIKLKIGATQEAAGITYFIKDNGVGFDMKYAERLFEPFSRLHHEREFKGTGVGLSLVHRIVKKHKGRIWAESKPNEGATFYLFMPNFKLTNATNSKALVELNHSV